MTTHFITAEIDLQASPIALNRAIEAELQKRGEPLRWSITKVDTEKQTVQVEAVVTTQAATQATTQSLAQTPDQALAPQSLAPQSLA
jgi:hypothetical protein